MAAGAFLSRFRCPDGPQFTYRPAPTDGHLGCSQVAILNEAAAQTSRAAFCVGTFPPLRVNTGGAVAGARGAGGWAREKPPTPSIVAAPCAPPPPNKGRGTPCGCTSPSTCRCQCPALGPTVQSAGAARLSRFFPPRPPARCSPRPSEQGGPVWWAGCPRAGRWPGGRSRRYSH